MNQSPRTFFRENGGGGRLDFPPVSPPLLFSPLGRARPAHKQEKCFKPKEKLMNQSPRTFFRENGGGGRLDFPSRFPPPSFFPLSAAPAPPINKKSALNPRKSLWTKAPALFSEKMGGGGRLDFFFFFFSFSFFLFIFLFLYLFSFIFFIFFQRKIWRGVCKK